MTARPTSYPMPYLFLQHKLRTSLTSWHISAAASDRETATVRAGEAAGAAVTKRAANAGAEEDSRPVLVAAEDLPADSADLRLALITKRDDIFLGFCSHTPERRKKKEVLKNSFVDFFLNFSICAMTTLSLISEKKTKNVCQYNVYTFLGSRLDFWRFYSH